MGRGRRLLACTGLSLALLGSAAAEPAIWQVGDEDSHIWLFGSVHLLDPNVAWRTPQFDALIEAADYIYFETLMTEAFTADSLQLTMRRGYYQDGYSLVDDLTPKQSAKLSAALARYGVAINRGQLNLMRPWLAELTIAMAAIDLHADPRQMTYASGVEMTLQAELEPERQRGLETIEQQIDAIAGGTVQEQIEALMLSVGELGTGDVTAGELMDAWLAGDVAGLEIGSVNDPRYRRLLTDRNRNWMDQISAALAQDEKAMVIVGAAHMPGPGGLLELLAASGYSVTRIDEAAARID